MEIDMIWRGNESGVNIGKPPDLIPSEIKEGMKLDVMSLLCAHSKSNTLVRCDGQVVRMADIVFDKPVVILCAPLSADHARLDFDYVSLIDTYTQSQREAAFDIVIVLHAWDSDNDTHSTLTTVSDPDTFESESYEPQHAFHLSPSYYESESAFNQFFLDFPFPPTCLLMPFSEVDTRNYIWSLADLPNPFMAMYIVVDTTGTISSFSCSCENLFCQYGRDWFPFDATHTRSLCQQDQLLRRRLDPLYQLDDEYPCQDQNLDDPLSLHDDILMRPLDFKLYPVNHPGEDDRSITLSQLSKKHVALYLCFKADAMALVNDLREQCISNKQDLHVVVVCLYPLISTKPADFKEDLQSFDTTESWFLFPYDGKVCRRLWRVFGQGDVVDKLIIIPPNCKSGELEGLAVLRNRGLELIRYPFTRSSIAEARVNYMKSLNVTRLFKGVEDSLTCLYQPSPDGGSRRPVPGSELEGKVLLIYLGWPYSYAGGEVRNLLKKHYPEVVAKGWEVVFIPQGFSEKSDSRFVSDMPWLIMSVSDSDRTEARKHLNFGHRDCVERIIVVGRDGKIVSTNAVQRMKEGGITDSLLSDEYLYQDIASQLQEEICDSNW